MPYFYCNSLPLEAGSVIRPGNWGRILRLYTRESHPNSWRLTRELAYELVRSREFPRKPSRFETVYVCLSEEDLNDFCSSANRRLDLRYEVELIDPQAPSHLGDWALPKLEKTDDLPKIEQRARLYWQGANIAKRELITLSPLRVTRALA